ncbi:MAG TPA: VOC family protein, partial [Chloroflexota bacterium]|nr:VOC family protein [Chloroflexota bacterium]
ERQTTMFSNIYHIGYLTEDNAAAIDFYVTMFRAELIGEGLSADGKSKMAFLKVGNSEVEFIEAPDRVKAAGKGSILLDHVGYLVPDIAAAAEELRPKGIKFLSDKPNVNPLGHQVHYLDPATTNGVRMHLTQR